MNKGGSDTIETIDTVSVERILLLFMNAQHLTDNHVDRKLTFNQNFQNFKKSRIKVLQGNPSFEPFRAYFMSLEPELLERFPPS